MWVAKVGSAWEKIGRAGLYAAVQPAGHSGFAGERVHGPSLAKAITHYAYLALLMRPQSLSNHARNMVV